MLNGTWVDRYAEVTAESSATAEAMLGDAAVGLRALSALRRASGLSKRPQQRPQQGGPCSFAGSTEVLMADGSLKPIDEVVVGDEVVATDPETGEQAAKRVSRVWVHRDDLIALALNADVDGDGRPDRLVTTEDHPFWNATDGVWEGPQDLDVGDELVDDHGRRVGVLGLEPGSTRVGWAYNLTVEDLHTYHVGASRILVHNTNGEACGTGAANTGVNLGPGVVTRKINWRPNAADPNWGLTGTHMNKHLFGNSNYSLSKIDSGGNADIWRGYMQDLASRPRTGTTTNGMIDIVGTFPRAGGGGNFQFGIRLSPNSNGSFDLITLLTKQ
ncbi:HINT domain-containing protein [Pimelobacter simplex]|uniref:HINT domain-containing protein n=1 Tax=Nocardioides simplex TaxID=2045 RepID=UPI00214FEB47|nr:HINT domain-containing protein [Pimelobacter simplex]UUW92396.1 HINT domain-containing protein [Pimelobacter simplex]UUW96224.1 HINT domain-containing protein [Pimelobacter simplex]